MLKQALAPLKANPVTAGATRTVGRWLTRNVDAFFFVATTGRSGTSTLKRLFDAAPGCIAEHEPEPVMNHDVMHSYNDDGALAHRQFITRKLPAIYRAARAGRWYAETNHMFIKAFAEPAVRAFGRKLRVVHLVRDPESVAASFVHRRIATYGSTEPRAYLYTLKPTAPRNLLRIWDDPAICRRFSHLFFEYLWYYYETEARVCRFTEQHPTVPVHRIETHQLNDPDSIEQLFDWAGLPFTAAVRSQVGLHSNRSPDGPPPPLPSGVDRSDVDAFHAICRERLADIDADAAAAMIAPVWDGTS